eukprot:351880-Chlamydomonas_euryale.AAC.5
MRPAAQRDVNQRGPGGCRSSAAGGQRTPKFSRRDAHCFHPAAASSRAGPSARPPVPPTACSNARKRASLATGQEPDSVPPRSTSRRRCAWRGRARRGRGREAPPIHTGWQTYRG